MILISWGMKSDFSVSVTLQSEEVKLRFRTMSYSDHATLYLLTKGPLSSRVLTFVRVSMNSQVFCRWSDSLTDLSYFVHQDNNQNLNGSLRAMKSHCQTYTESPPVFVMTSCLLKLTMSHMEAETHEGIHKNETRSAQLRSLLKQTKTTSCNIHFFQSGDYQQVRQVFDVAAVLTEIQRTWDFKTWDRHEGVCKDSRKYTVQ